MLSAGALFGAWQAGAWKALHGRFQPDIVIGASAGAWNGWAIAGGCGPDELAREWLSPSTARLMRLRFPWLPWRGVFRPEPLLEKAQELFAAYRPRVPYGAVLVELPAFRVRLVRDPEIGWRHLAAFCAIPGGYPPLRLDGKLYCDGGLLSALPLWAAAHMGAGRIVALNAMPRVPSRVLRAAVRSIRAAAPARPPRAALPLIEIRPSQELGTLRDLVHWTPENTQRWIDLGQRDADLAFSSAGGSITM